MFFHLSAEIEHGQTSWALCEDSKKEKFIMVLGKSSFSPAKIPRKLLCEKRVRLDV